MTDRAGFFAGCADILTEMCVYYAVAGILVMSGRGWGLHLFWLLLCAAVWAGAFVFILRIPRSVPFLTAVTGGMFLASMGVFWLASATPMTFGYGFVLAIGAGMAAGLPLYYALHRPLIHKHLARLDVLILVLAALMLVRQALGIDAGTVALTVLVLLMDAAAAVGLRMSDGELNDGRNAFKASMTALISAAILALLICLFVAVFSRSGSAAGAVLEGIGSFFAMIGRGFERFFRWVSSLVTVRDDTAPLELEEMPSLAGLDSQTTHDGMDMTAGAVGAVLVLVLIAALAVLLSVFRKKRISAGTGVMISAADHPVRRTGGSARAIWKRILEELSFRWTAFIRRDTPAGVLLALERRGKRSQRPRQTGESMRQFILRMDAGGGLDALADALDREYYAGEKNTLSPQRCRALRRYIRKAV